jgi:uncharacterized protein YdeI (YjbR/CyaY-like superfamily)
MSRAPAKSGSKHEPTAAGLAEPLYFQTPEALRSWFRKHHARAAELVLGYWKVGSGEPSVTWPESVDEALCVGWIDGVRRRLDDQRYTIRFTPRRPGSVWSQVNVRRIGELVAAGRMQPAGLAVFAARGQAHERGYSFADRAEHFAPELEASFREHASAWAFFEKQPPGYRRAAIHWVGNAKQEATKRKRLATLIADSAAGLRLGRTTKYAGK